MQIEPGEKTVVVKEAIHPYRWTAVAIAFLVIGIGFFLTVRDLRHKDSEIQSSRVTSCRQTYSAFNEVFLPFFPPKAKRTKEQQDNLDKLHRTIRRRQARCSVQINISK